MTHYRSYGMSDEARVVIECKGKNVAVGHYVEELCLKIVFALLSTLKGVDISGDEQLIITLKK
ncbi:MAG: hypothetical protein ACE5JL_18935, partial [Dehalococcoidia bacterium]